jgi:2Fe-2S ferredoxin
MPKWSTSSEFRASGRSIGDGDDVAVLRVVNRHGVDRHNRSRGSGSSDRTRLIQGERMAKLIVRYENGEPERVIEFDPLKAPFGHDGKPASILDVMLGHGLFLEHACGGVCACTTCHVVVKKGTQALVPAEENEEDLLDKAVGLTPTSRLGCQSVVTDPDAVIEVVVPRYTVNIDSGTHGR